MTLPFDSDTFHAAVTAAAQRIAATAEKHGIEITPDQCQDLAETLIHHYQSFLAGVHHATKHPPTGQ